MKRIQPYYYIVALACIFILGGLVQFSIKLLPAAESTGITIDPQTDRQGEDLYDFWFSDIEIYDLSVDHALNKILFSADNKVVSLIDRDRKLKWEKIFAYAPNQAKISSCGNYAAIGTEGGRLHFTATDLEFQWDDEGNPVELIALSPNANWIAVARSKPEQELHHLDFYNRNGELKWSVETGSIKNLFLTSEYLEQANIYYTLLEDEEPSVIALDLQGNELWSYENQTLAAVSRHGSRLATLDGSMLTVYDSLGYSMWSKNLPFEADRVLFNPQNYNRLLVYGSREGAEENLYYFDLAEDLLWMKRIDDGSLFSFTADGQNVVTSSWRHYKEDYTQMKMVNREGLEINSWEVAMRVEHLVFVGHPHLAVVCGEDGYIDLIDLRPLLREENDNNDIQKTQIYDPVTTGIRADETNLTLYFVDDNNKMIPVTRSVSYTEDPLNAALIELIRGPARDSSLYRTIPNKDITIEAEYNSEDGSLFIELSPGLIEMSSASQSKIAFDSLILTISKNADVEQIYLLVNGEQIDTFGEDLALNQPLAPADWTKLIYVPVISGDRYYLMVEEGAAANEDFDLQYLVSRALHACRSLPFVPTNIDLLELNKNSEQIQVNLNSAIRAIFPENPTEREQLQAALVLDALFMTVFNNSRTERVEILIDGEPWTTPEGYPSASRFYRQPSYINPEQ